MRLIIDEGNSFCKVSVYDEERCEVFAERVEEMEAERIGEIIGQHGVRKSIYSTVRVRNEEVARMLGERTEFVFFDANTPVPLEIKYSSPQTLGRDRVAACVGARCLDGENNLLVIDIGTAVTYDIVTASGEYLGGNISPGFEMRLKALHTFTSKLPLVPLDGEAKEIGDCTTGAIYSGCYLGLLHEIDGFCEQFARMFGSISIFLTGGGAKYFADKLKFKNFVVSNLQEIGLCRIIDGI